MRRTPSKLVTFVVRSGFLKIMFRAFLLVFFLAACIAELDSPQKKTIFEKQIEPKSSSLNKEIAQLDFPNQFDPGSVWVPEDFGNHVSYDDDFENYDDDSISSGGGDGGNNHEDDNSPSINKNSPKWFFDEDVKKIELEVVYGQNAKPYVGNSILQSDVWNITRKNLQKLFESKSKDIVVPSKLSDMEQIPLSATGNFSVEKILDLAKKHRKLKGSSSSGSLFILFLPRYFEENGQAHSNVLGVSLGDSGVIAMFKDSYSKGLLLEEEKRIAEQAILVHELGHAFGLVNRGIPLKSNHHHSAKGAHCTDNDCVMYWSYESLGGMTNFIQKQMQSRETLLFGPACLEDAKSFQP